jgi:NADPH:quinone reductase-like Zn-dependent oxidoreductase
MQAAYLVKTGDASTAFQIREVPAPKPAEDEILIKVAASGINYADIMARHGMYKEAPPLPALLGYDVAGTVAAKGHAVQGFEIDTPVLAMTRFGGYAQYAVTKASAATPLPPSIDFATATALATQYCTAYYAAAIMVNLLPHQNVLIQSGAGGVGTALVQYALHKGCTVFATAGSDEKVNLLKNNGVQYPINYNSTDFKTIVMQHTGGKGVDVVFDAVGGTVFKKGMQCLAAGGRMVVYGASGMTGVNLFQKIRQALAFGFYHPFMLMMPSKAIIGVNMLRIADEKPETIGYCLQQVTALVSQGIFTPPAAKTFAIADIAAAHEWVEKRNSSGKVALLW